MKSTLDQKIETLVESFSAIHISRCFSRPLVFMFIQAGILNQITLKGTSSSEFSTITMVPPSEKIISSSEEGRS